MKSRYEKQMQLRRIDHWLQQFHEESPVLFTLFAAGIGLMVAGGLLCLLDLLDRLS